MKLVHKRFVVGPKGEVFGVQKILKISNGGVAGIKFSVEGGPCSLGGSQGF